jgi:hypothetical protein
MAQIHVRLPIAPEDLSSTVFLDPVFVAVRGRRVGICIPRSPRRKKADIMSRFAEGSFDGLVPECLCSEKRIFVNRVRARAHLEPAMSPRVWVVVIIEIVVPVLFNTGSSGGVGIGSLAVAALLPVESPRCRCLKL